MARRLEPGPQDRDEGKQANVVSLDQVVAEADRYREVLTVGRYHPDYAPRCYELEYMFSRLGDVEELEEHRSLIKELAALLGMGTKISTATEVLNNKPVFRWWFDLWREIDQDSRQFAA